MLSIAIIKSTAQAVTYFEVDDYYTKSGENPEALGVWHGGGAERLGFAGIVDPQHFKLMLEGHLPNGQILGTATEDDTKHTPGWDLTFSAPKGVSIVAEIGRDGRVFEAHQKAVAKALEWVEAHSLGTRVRSPLARLFLKTPSLVAALFTHHTSRNLDPDLHTHSVLMNAVEREGGRWASVHSHMLFKHKMVVGTIYRATLALELQAAGYEIEVTHRDGRFEIVGIPEDIRIGLSSRTTEIQQKKKEMGVDDAESAQLANLLTRKSKKSVDRSELFQKWRQYLEGKNFDVDAFVNATRAAGPRQPGDGISFETALKDSIDILSQREAVFSHGDVVRFTLAALMGRADVDAVEKLIKGAEQDGRLRRVDFAGLEQWTTPKALEQERRIIQTMLKGRNTREPIARPQDIERDLNGREMNAKQRNAANMILTTRDQFVLVVGLPGVGKTTFMLKNVHEIGSKRGKRFVGMAQNASVAGRLEEDTGMPSTTIHTHLAKLGKDLAALRRGGWSAQAIRQKYRNEVWVVDEGSQLPNVLKRRLLNAVEKLGVQAVIVGDHRQIGAIEAGDPFNLLRTRGAQVAEIDKIMRTKNDTQIKAIHEIRRGDVTKALETLEPFTKEIKDGDKRIEEMLRVYKELGDLRSETLLVTARNDEKIKLNDGVRKILLEEGKLTNDTPRNKLVSVPSTNGELRDARTFEPGFIVRFGQDLSNGVKKDEYWRVREIDKHTNTVVLARLEDEAGKKTIRWNPRMEGTAGREAAEVFKMAKSSLAEGDLVRWSKNGVLDNVELFNGDLLRVARIEGERTTFVTRGGRGQEITIDQSRIEAAHWGHAYATTMYSSQGWSVRIVLVNAESNRRELLSQKAFLVAISRQKETLWIFTDDVKKLERSLLNFPGDKSTATEAVDQTRAVSAAGLANLIFDGWIPPKVPNSRMPPPQSIGI